MEHDYDQQAIAIQSTHDEELQNNDHIDSDADELPDFLQDLADYAEDIQYGGIPIYGYGGLYYINGEWYEVDSEEDIETLVNNTANQGKGKMKGNPYNYRSEHRDPDIEKEIDEFFDREIPSDANVVYRHVWAEDFPTRKDLLEHLINGGPDGASFRKQAEQWDERAAASNARKEAKKKAKKEGKKKVVEDATEQMEVDGSKSFEEEDEAGDANDDGSEVKFDHFFIVRDKWSDSVWYENRDYLNNLACGSWHPSWKVVSADEEFIRVHMPLYKNEDHPDQWEIVRMLGLNNLTQVTTEPEQPSWEEITKAPLMFMSIDHYKLEDEDDE